MKDDPTVKDVLNAAADLPKKVGKTVLEARIPVGAVKRGFQFVMSHWLSGVLSLAVLVWVSSHYLSEMKNSQYTCYGPRADFTLPNEPSDGIVISAAIAISPITQLWASMTFAEGTPDPDYDFKAFISENDPNLNYARILAPAQSESEAMALLKYARSQAVARCIADKSWLTALVVFAHALVAYVIFVNLGRLKQAMYGD